jgi:hypothetical protein
MIAVCFPVFRGLQHLVTSKNILSPVQRMVRQAQAAVEGGGGGGDVSKLRRQQSKVWCRTVANGYERAGEVSRKVRTLHLHRVPTPLCALVCACVCVLFSVAHQRLLASPRCHFAVVVSCVEQIVAFLLNQLPTFENRMSLLRMEDAEGWSALHFAARFVVSRVVLITAALGHTAWACLLVDVCGICRSGLLGSLNLTSLLGPLVENLPVNAVTLQGLTMLHLVRRHVGVLVSDVVSFLLATDSIH